MPNIFKLNNKDIIKTTSASVVNLEHILHFILLLILLNSSKSKLVRPEKLQFQEINLFSVNVKKNFVQWVGKIFWNISFHVSSLNIRLQKDKFSWHPFKKISTTLVSMNNNSTPNSLHKSNKSYFQNLTGN